MFSGIIGGIGKIRQVQTQGQAIRLSFQAPAALITDMKIGDSLAVNGVCLTAIALNGREFAADVMPESFRRTNLAQLRPNDPVNLERALPANGRFEGHVVQGHVDGVGRLRRRWQEQTALWLSIGYDSQLAPQIVSKGAIALDGVSLTVVRATGSELTVSMIPHSQEETILQTKKVGQLINIETDILGKYMAQLVQQHYWEQQA